jgi:hypothetical protein
MKHPLGKFPGVHIAIWEGKGPLAVPQVILPGPDILFAVVKHVRSLAMPLTVVYLTDVDVSILVGNGWYVCSQRGTGGQNQKQEEE